MFIPDSSMLQRLVFKWPCKQDVSRVMRTGACDLKLFADGVCCYSLYHKGHHITDILNNTFLTDVSISHRLLYMRNPHWFTLWPDIESKAKYIWISLNLIRPKVGYERLKSAYGSTAHDNIMTRKRFRHYWPSVRWAHWLPKDSQQNVR